MKVVIYRKGKKCLLQSLPAWLLVELNKEITKLRNIKKPRHKGPPRYGSLSRAFTQSELHAFLSACHNEKLRNLFTLQALLGLRIGEVVRIKESDVMNDYSLLQVHTEKAKTIDFMPLSPAVGQLLFEWIQEHKVAIDAAEGYIFFSCNRARKMPHISSNWARREFRQIAEQAGLNMSYGISRGNVKIPNKRLFRLTTHSLRHFFATQIYGMTKDMRQTQMLMRHKDIKSTAVYTHIGIEEMAATLEKLKII